MIELDDRDGVRVLALAHGKANAFDLELTQKLDDALTAAAQEEAGAVVLAGGEHIFSAGVDLERVLEGGEAYLRDFLPALQRLFTTLLEFPRPLVAAVGGHAIAGGCLVACAADVRLAARGPARIGVPELSVGVAFPTAALEILRLRVPPQYLPQIVYGARNHDVEDALRLGLVDELVEPGELLQTARQRARALAALPAEAFRLAKQTWIAPARAALERHAVERDAQVVRQWCRPESLARIRAFVERTLGGGTA